RFNLVACQLLRTMADAEHPLVLFLDDLQWADDASLRLLRVLLADSELSYLLFLGSYRDNEVDEKHPLQRMLASLTHEGKLIHTLTLLPLGLGSVQSLISESLHATPEQALPLAELVLGKTQGNPFFASQFLTTLYRKGFLSFDPTEGQWIWDLAQIRQEDI